MKTSATAMLPLPAANSSIRWFSARGCVVDEGGSHSVLVGGTLVGAFSEDEPGVRNVLLVGLAADPHMHLGQLAEAFGITSEALRLIRRVHERDGIDPLWSRARGGSHPKVTPAIRARLTKLFENGATVKVAHEKTAGRLGLSSRTIARVHATWLAAQATPAGPVEPPVIELPPPPPPADKDIAPTSAAPKPATLGSEEEGTRSGETIAATPPSHARAMQHAGSWLMVAMIHHLGLYAQAATIAKGRVEGGALRIALDAVIVALSIGQKCVEGVRRLATLSAPSLLRAARAPSASWARRVLGLFSQEAGGARLQLGMAGSYIRAASEEAAEAPVVFYVDNHMRPYTGKHVIRRGWRMQDKRVLPGASDYYVHDEDGRPVLRVHAPHHGSLTDFLTPIARLLRLALEPSRKILLAFDRGGAFPAQMAELREEGFEFVTYERRPYPLLTESAFGDPIELDGEYVRICETRANLGHRRGRVRRIAARQPDGRQVNLMAISEQPAEWLLGVMAGRWVQENGFKHGVERWGVNQLDGRTVNAYPPDTIIPNPARNRLDRALRIARVREGDARRELSRLPTDHPRCGHYVSEVAEAIAQQEQLLAQRPSMPKHAPLVETELAGKLVRHESEYKATIDTIRIACANAESDLAGELGVHLARPAEAKMALANLLAAPGRVRVGKRTIGVTLMPAGTKNEQAAFAALLSEVNRWNLTLPGDPLERRLQFRAQV